MVQKRASYSVLSPGCPSRVVLERIADKWTALIIQVLARGTLRYSALRREIGDISQKMLTQTLRSLETDGLVSRKVSPTVPVTVEYSLTLTGKTLSAPLAAVRTWAESHIDAVLAARARARRANRPGGAAQESSRRPG